MGLSAQSDFAEKRLINLNTQEQKAKRKQRYGKKLEQSTNELWKNFKQPNKSVTGVISRQRENKGEKLNYGKYSLFDNYKLTYPGSSTNPKHKKY